MNMSDTTGIDISAAGGNDSVIIALIITNIGLQIVSQVFQFMKRIRKSSCCGSTMELSRSDSTPQPSQKNIV